MSETSPRTRALREVLVEQATTTRRPASSRWRFGALLAAVALASGATGALSAAAIVGSAPYEDNVLTSLALSIARPNSVAVGQPHYVASSSTASIDLGSAPDGATGVAIRTSCTEPGSVEISLDSVWVSGLTCDSQSPTGGSGGVLPIAGTAPHVLSFSSPTGTGYEAMVLWVTEPPMPTASAQQLSEIADGVATRDEYIAAFNRFTGCMGAEGYDIRAADPDAVILSYALPSAAVDSGADELCYNTQFGEVDMLWQLQNPPS